MNDEPMTPERWALIQAGARAYLRDVDEGHETDGTPCWCSPTIEEDDEGNRLVVHRRGMET